MNIDITPAQLEILRTVVEDVVDWSRFPAWRFPAHDDRELNTEIVAIFWALDKAIMEADRKAKQ
jgi:hypothetical protein